MEKEKVKSKRMSKEAKFQKVESQVLSELSLRQLERLSADLIESVFDWEDSEEGNDYWNEVYMRLYKRSKMRYGKQRIR